MSFEAKSFRQTKRYLGKEMEGVWKFGNFQSYPGYLEAKAPESEGEYKGLQDVLDADASVHKRSSITSPPKGRSCHSQATDDDNDVNKKETDGDQERAEAKVDLDEQHGELGDHADEDDELPEARDKKRDDRHEDTDTVVVRRRHGAIAVPRAKGEAGQAQIRAAEQRDDRVAGPPDGGK